jgi:hypothetical protein
MIDYIRAAVLLVVAVLFVGLRIRQLVVVRRARKWPSVEGRIEFGQLEQVAGGRSGVVILPVFSFSYQVAGEYYAGRFALSPYITDPFVTNSSFIQHMVGRTVRVTYNATQPEVWHIADKLIEGCKVEQRFSNELVSYAPRD